VRRKERSSPPRTGGDGPPRAHHWRRATGRRRIPEPRSKGRNGCLARVGRILDDPGHAWLHPPPKRSSRLWRRAAALRVADSTGAPPTSSSRRPSRPSCLAPSPSSETRSCSVSSHAPPPVSSSRPGTCGNNLFPYSATTVAGPVAPEGALLASGHHPRRRRRSRAPVSSGRFAASGEGDLEPCTAGQPPHGRAPSRMRCCGASSRTPPWSSPTAPPARRSSRSE
jgi:hypothetical protein